MIGLDGGPLPVPAHPVALLDRAGLAGAAASAQAPLVGRADGADRAAYHRLRRDVFVGEQGLFQRHDLDAIDSDPATVVLVARDATGTVVGGVRVSPVGDDPTGGWWAGSRLAVTPGQRGAKFIGAALVRAACAVVEDAGALRFDAAVQPAVEPFFARLGWSTVGACQVAGRPHVAMRWPIARAARLAQATKAPLASLLAGMYPGGSGWVGDDAAPVSGSDLVAACDAIAPAMVERDPDWAGWCSVLVNVNDLAAMGAEPVALLDAVAAPTVSAAARILGGLRRAAAAYGVAVIGGHTQIGVPAALSVTALGRAANPVPGGGRPAR